MGPRLEEIVFYLGEHNNDENVREASEVAVKAEKLIVHPMYNIRSENLFLLREPNLSILL